MEVPSSFRALQREAGIWAVNKDAFLDTIQPWEGQEDAYDALADMVEHKRKIVVMLGESRSGKSWLGSGYINLMLKNEQVLAGEKPLARYMTFFDLELMLRSSQTQGTMDRLFNELVRIPQLFIDEMGRGKWSEFTATFFTNLIIRRHGENRYTVIGTNLSGADLKEMLDIALLERLKEENSIVLVRKI